jgi:class 3 adenylate cyclase
MPRRPGFGDTPRMSTGGHGSRAREPSATSRRPKSRPDSAARVAHLERELAESLAREAATAEVLGVIGRSRADPQPVFQAILERATQLCDARLGALYLLDGELLRAVAAHGPTDQTAELLRQTPFPRDSAPLRREGPWRPLQTPDFREAPLYQRGEPFIRRWVDEHGLRTWLGVPLVAGERYVGSLVIWRQEVRPFGEPQVELVSTFADQAVIAIENARLFRELRDRTAELAELNHTLEARVTEQVEQLDRVGRLRRYLSPQLADLIVSSGDESILASHRRQITAVFCDLRGFTAFAETAEPEEVVGVLGEYHAALGELIRRYEGTLDRFAGDGLMVFFNDPLPQPDHAERAVRMACAMRDRAAGLARGWRRQGHELGLGIGIAVGYATLGRIGFEGRSDYTAIGTVTNLAARLCGEAADGQVVIHGRVHSMVEELVEAESLGELVLKGLHRPVAAFNVLGLRDA